MSPAHAFPSSTGADQPHQPARSPQSAAEPAIHLGRTASRSRPPQAHRFATLPSPVLIASQTLSLLIDQSTLMGELELPTQATGLVVVGHCNGNSRLSSRSRHLSRLLQQADLGVFSVDLLTPAEARQLAGPAHLSQLTQRLVTLCRWLYRQPELLGLRIGLLGEGVAAVAALEAAAQLDAVVGALVSFGGEGAPTATSLPLLPAPTLLLIGEYGAAQTPLTYQPFPQANGARPALQVIPQAGCTFQEPGKLAQAGTQAAAWFNCYLAKPRSMRS